MIILVLILIIIIIICLSIILQYRKQIRNINVYLIMLINDVSKTKIKSDIENTLLNELIVSLNEFIEKYNNMRLQFQNNKKQYQSLISAIAHDFKTPATSVLGYIELMEDEEKFNLEYFQIIKKRIHKLNELIDDFFTLSILESNEYPYVLEQTNPTNILREQLSIYYDELTNIYQDIAIHLTINKIYIMSDVKALHRIFSNILKNAIDHGESNLKIEDKIINNDYVITFENSNSDNKRKNYTNTGIGLKTIHKLSKELEIIVDIEESDTVFLISITFHMRKKG